MDVPIAKLTPTAVVAAMVGYCCWSHLEPVDPPAQGPPGPQGPEVAIAQLRPAAPPDPARDPFGLLPPVVAEPPPKPKKVEAAKNVSQAALAAARAESDKLLSSLALHATWIRGDRAVALINGRLYTQGDSLRDASNSLAPATLAQILPDRVLVDHQGRLLELRFPDREARAGSALQAAPRDNEPGGDRR